MTNPMASLHKKRNRPPRHPARTHTCKERGRPCDHRGRDWSDAGFKPRNTRVAGDHQRLGERHETILPLNPQEGTNAAGTLTLDSRSLKQWENKQMLSQATPVVVLCYSYPGKVVQ